MSTPEPVDGNRWNSLLDAGNLSPFETLTREYQTWCKAQQLPDMSADELLNHLCRNYPEGVNPDQTAWLDDFIERWDEMVERDPEYVTDPPNTVRRRT